MIWAEEDAVCAYDDALFMLKQQKRRKNWEELQHNNEQREQRADLEETKTSCVE